MIKQIIHRLNKIEKLLIDGNHVVIENYMNTDEASKFLRIKKSTLYQHIHKKTVPHYKQGKLVLFKRSDLMTWVEDPDAIHDSNIENLLGR